LALRVFNAGNGSVARRTLGEKKLLLPRDCDEDTDTILNEMPVSWLWDMFRDERFGSKENATGSSVKAFSL